MCTWSFYSARTRSTAASLIVYRVQTWPPALSGSLQQRTSVLLVWFSLIVNVYFSMRLFKISYQEFHLCKAAALPTWQLCSCINLVLSEDPSPHSCTAAIRTFPAQLQSFTSCKDRLYDEPVKLSLRDMTGLWSALPSRRQIYSPAGIPSCPGGR